MPYIPKRKKMPWETTAKKKKHMVHHTNRWKELSEQVRKEEPLCKECIKKGIITPSTQTDHIIPVSQGGIEERSNLQALCDQCHYDKSKKEKGINK